MGTWGQGEPTKRVKVKGWEEFDDLPEGEWVEVVGGWAQWWCACCLAAEQLRYARQLSRRIPELEQEVAVEKGQCAVRRGPRISVTDGGIVLGRTRGLR